MSVAAAHVQGWGREVEGLVEGRLHSADEGAEVGQVKQVEVEKILVVHAIMIALLRKVIAVWSRLMIRTMVQLTEEQMQALKELATARKTSVARLVRESVAQYVVTTNKEAEREEKRRRALEFIKYIEEHPEEFRDIEGKTDVSINHDEYFVQSIEDDLR